VDGEPGALDERAPPLESRRAERRPGRVHVPLDAGPPTPGPQTPDVRGDGDAGQTRAFLQRPELQLGHGEIVAEESVSAGEAVQTHG
jgi:hypothetical protein